MNQMIRVLHLVPASADFQTERGVTQLAMFAREGFAIEVKTIGSRGDWPSVFSASRAMRHLAGVDVIHAWGVKALTVAVMGSRRPVVYSPAPDTQRRSARWLSAIMQYRDVEIVAPSATLRNSLLRSGIAPEK